MALEVETYTNAAGVVCMRLKRTGDDPPAPSNVTPLRAGEVLARGMTPIEAARGTTRSSIVHAPVAPSRPVVHGVQQPTADDLKIAAMLGVTPEAFAAQRRAEQTGAGGASRWRSGAVGGDE